LRAAAMVGGSLKIWSHSEKNRLGVIITLRRSYRPARKVNRHRFLFGCTSHGRCRPKSPPRSDPDALIRFPARGRACRGANGPEVYLHRRPEAAVTGLDKPLGRRRLS
jgi:hypothetical protein